MRYSKLGAIILGSVILLVVVALLYWWHIDPEGLDKKIPIGFGFVAVIAAVLAIPWSQYIRSQAPNPEPVLPPSPTNELMPEDLLAWVKGRLKEGTTAVIVRAEANEATVPFHLFKKHQFYDELWEKSRHHQLSMKDLVAARVKAVPANRYPRYGDTYAAIFESIEPDDYVVWRGDLSTYLNQGGKTVGVDAYRPGDVREIYF